MLAFNLLVLAAISYVAFLFIIAFLAERRAIQHKGAWLRSPLIYTLSLSIYCTAWTFYGAVGYAARSGLEYLTIYLGPTLVMIGWFWLLRKLVRIGRAQRVTSIADLISGRYGKSTFLGALVTLLAVVGVTPYIALQLQSITQSFSVFTDKTPGVDGSDAIAFWSAVGLAIFTVLFGTRNLDANERHHGVVMAIAVEAVVKLCALLAVGLFVTFALAGGLGGIIDAIEASPIAKWQQSGPRWVGLTFLSAAALLTLPRMFHVLVVENADERHLATASWAFPAYMAAMSLFVAPIAAVGLDRMPEGSNPDLFVLSLPLTEGWHGLATLSFLGGFSSATSMVIVATIALATMVSNHIALPLWLRLTSGGATVSGDVRAVVLVARRLSIAGLIGMGYLYFRLSGGSEALAAIGLISFAGVAQVLPAMLGGVFWRGATRPGAAAGLLAGFGLWLWTLFLPGLGGGVISAQVLAEGPLGLGWLRPEALFGITGLDPLLHAVFWSMLFNSGLFVLVSLLTFPGPIERLQGAQFVNIFDHAQGARSWAQGAATAEDLLVMAQRIIGAGEAQAIFQRVAAGQGKAGYLPDVTSGFIEALERELAGSVGAATAHAMIGRLTEGQSVSVEDLMAVADEAAQIMEYSARLEAKSEEQERTARALRDANDKLMKLSEQKDAFLSQISHELRTPMTSIRAFSEILRGGSVAGEAEQRRYAGIIGEEAERLSRLLDDLLDISVLENGQVVLNRSEATLRQTLERAIGAAGLREGALTIRRKPAEEDILLAADHDRLAQVFINLIANARKYCAAPQPELRIEARQHGGEVTIDFIDNGKGIATEHSQLIFEKFSRLTDGLHAGGAGLGLAICREIMERLGGSICYLPAQGGGAFRLRLPVAGAAPASSARKAV